MNTFWNVKSHKTLLLGAITARKDNSIKSPCVAEEFEQYIFLCNHSTKAEVHGTAWLEKKICMHVCTCMCTHKCIYDHTQAKHTLTLMQKIFKYPKCIIFTLHANLSVRMFEHIDHGCQRVVTTSFKYHFFAGNVQHISSSALSLEW